MYSDGTTSLSEITNNMSIPRFKIERTPTIAPRRLDWYLVLYVLQEHRSEFPLALVLLENPYMYERLARSFWLSSL